MLQILIFSVNVFCQESDQLNQSDSLGNKIGLWVEYDIEHFKYSEIMYVEKSSSTPSFRSRLTQTACPGAPRILKSSKLLSLL